MRNCNPLTSAFFSHQQQHYISSTTNKTKTSKQSTCLEHTSQLSTEASRRTELQTSVLALASSLKERLIPLRLASKEVRPLALAVEAAALENSPTARLILARLERREDLLLLKQV